MNWRKARRCLPVLGFLLFGIVLSRLDLRRIGATLVQARPALVVAATFLVLFSFMLKAIRHVWILRAQGLELSSGMALRLYFHTAFWGFVSPGRVGEMSRTVYLQPYVNDHIKTITNVILDRVLDLLTILLLGGLSAILSGERIMGLVMVCLLAVVAASALFMHQVQRIWLVNRDGRLAQIIRRVHHEFFHLNDKYLLLLFSVIIWMFYYGGMYLFYRSMDHKLDFWFVVLAVVVSNLLSLLPVTVFGIGTRDAYLLYAFAGRSCSGELALSFSAFFLYAFLVQCLFCAMMMLVDRKHERVAVGSVSGQAAKDCNCSEPGA